MKGIVMNEIQNRAAEIFCIVDDLLKHMEKLMPLGISNKNRKSNKGRHKTWGASIVITLGILEFLYHSAEIKAFYNLAEASLGNAFGKWLSYERYLQLRIFYVPYTVLCLWLLMEPLKKAGLYFIDSAPLPVCHIKRASSHKVTAGIARRSKNTKGWFFGLKLHIVVNPAQDIVAFHITPGNVDDRKPLRKLLRKLKGLCVGDAGYVSKKWRKFFLELGLLLLVAPKKNMKKLMTKSQHGLLKARQIVETVLSVLISRFHIARSLPRSVMGHIANYVYGLLAYCINNVYKYALPNMMIAC
jgi:IS5 family transposase